MQYYQRKIHLSKIMEFYTLGNAYLSTLSKFHQPDTVHNDKPIPLSNTSLIDGTVLSLERNSVTDTF